MSGYPPRYCELFKQKFHRMAREQKLNGNSKCPSPIRRAKVIVCNIMGRATRRLNDKHCLGSGVNRRLNGAKGCT